MSTSSTSSLQTNRRGRMFTEDMPTTSPVVKIFIAVTLALVIAIVLWYSILYVVLKCVATTLSQELESVKNAFGYFRNMADGANKPSLSTAEQSKGKTASLNTTKATIRPSGNQIIKNVAKNAALNVVENVMENVF